MSYTNADGLYVLTHGGQGAVQDKGGTVVSARQTLVYDISDFTAIGSSFGASDIDPLDPVIPAGSLIVGATLVMTTAATGSSSTLTIGTYNAAGSAIDADGIDATIALTAIDADGDVVRCDGAQVSGVLGYLTADAYIGAIYGASAFTAGAGKLIVEYVQLT